MPCGSVVCGAAALAVSGCAVKVAGICTNFSWAGGIIAGGVDGVFSTIRLGGGDALTGGATVVTGSCVAMCVVVVRCLISPGGINLIGASAAPG